MGNLVVVTSKVPKSLKERAKQLGINISKVIREALEEAVRKKELEIELKSLETCSKILKKIDINRIVESIREDREGR